MSAPLDFNRRLLEAFCAADDAFEAALKKQFNREAPQRRYDHSSWNAEVSAAWRTRRAALDLWLTATGDV